jgi:hypothetical protein
MVGQESPRGRGDYGTRTTALRIIRAAESASAHRLTKT